MPKHHLADEIERLEQLVTVEFFDGRYTVFGPKGVSSQIGKTTHFYAVDARTGDKPEESMTWKSATEARYYALANAVNGGW